VLARGCAAAARVSGHGHSSACDAGATWLLPDARTGQAPREIDLGDLGTALLADAPRTPSLYAVINFQPDII
jgi:hypothetical protein